MPTLLFERGSRAVPVDFRRCRSTACGDGAEQGLVRRTDAGLPVTAFVHVVDCRPGAAAESEAEGADCSGPRAGNLYLQYWTYYADSATLRGVPIVGEAGYHADDWEGVQIRIRPDGGIDERASSHNGYNYAQGRRQLGLRRGHRPAQGRCRSGRPRARQRLGPGDPPAARLRRQPRRQRQAASSALRPPHPRQPRPPDPAGADRRRRPHAPLRDQPAMAQARLARPRGRRDRLTRIFHASWESVRAGYFGGIRRAPSRRIVSPLSIGLATIWPTSWAYSAGRPRREGKGMPAPSACARLLGQRGEQRRVEEAGGDRHDPDAARGHVARRRQGHADDAALRGRVGDLADLAVVGGDRGGVDADAALALLVGLVLAHRRRRQAQHVEGADQVDLDHVGEELEVVGAALVGDPLGPADPGAADRDAQPAVGGRGPLDRRRRPPPRRSRRPRRSSRPSPSSAASASPFSALRSAIVTRAPASASARAVASPSPEAPPATSAPVPSIRIARTLRGRISHPGDPTSLGFSHRHRGDGKLQGSDRGTSRRGARAHPGADRAARRRAAQPRLLADPQPAGLGPRPHRQLRGALAGADDRRPRAAARRPRPLLRRDREPAQDPRRAADPARRRAARLPRRRPRAHPRGARRGRDRPRRRGPAAARRLRLRDAARPRAPAQRDDAAAAADGRRLRAGASRPRRRRAGSARARSRDGRGRRRGARDRRPRRRLRLRQRARAATRSSWRPSRSTGPRSPTAVYVALHRGDRRRAAAVLGARRRGGLGQHRDGAPRRRSTRPSRHPRLLAARPTPSPAGPASGCRPSRSGRRRARASRASARSGSGPSSDFLAYPGFEAFPYREYSEVFFGDAYKVLRGGSWATHRSVIRPSFRNWDLPQRRQIFAGIRCARDA